MRIEATPFAAPGQRRPRGAFWCLILFFSAAGSLVHAEENKDSRFKPFGDFRLRLEQDWDSLQGDGTSRADRLRSRIRLRAGVDVDAQREVVDRGDGAHGLSRVSAVTPHHDLRFRWRLDRALPGEPGPLVRGLLIRWFRRVGGPKRALLLAPGRPVRLRQRDLCGRRRLLPPRPGPGKADLEPELRRPAGGHARLLGHGGDRAAGLREETSADRASPFPVASSRAMRIRTTRPPPAS